MYENIPGALPFQQNVTERDPSPGGSPQSRPDAAHTRVPLDLYPQVPSEPLRKGDFYAEGKPEGHAWAYARKDFFLNFATLFIDSWGGDSQRVAKYIRSNIVRTPLGAQHAFVERVNIERAPSIPYGSMYEVQGPTGNILDLRADYAAMRR